MPKKRSGTISGKEAASLMTGVTDVLGSRNKQMKDDLADRENSDPSADEDDGLIPARKKVTSTREIVTFTSEEKDTAENKVGVEEEEEAVVQKPPCMPMPLTSKGSGISMPTQLTRIASKDTITRETFNSNHQLIKSVTTITTVYTPHSMWEKRVKINFNGKKRTRLVRVMGPEHQPSAVEATDKMSIAMLLS